MGEDAARVYIREMLESAESEGLTPGWQAYRIARSMDGIIGSIENCGPEVTLKIYGSSIKLQPEIEAIIRSTAESYPSALSALAGIEGMYRKILEEEYGLRPFSIIDAGHKEDKMSGLDNGGMVHLLDTFLMVHALSSDMEPEKLLEMFFDFGLTPYYSPLHAGIDLSVGNFIYRLSDRMPKEKRKRIMLYPSPGGSLIYYAESDPESPTRWDTLEDFRRQWEEKNPMIPTFEKSLPEGVAEMYALPKRLLSVIEG
jgi:hypothetical protein